MGGWMGVGGGRNIILKIISVQSIDIGLTGTKLGKIILTEMPI